MKALIRWIQLGLPACLAVLALTALDHSRQAAAQEPKTETKPALSQEQLEQKFRDTLHQSTFSGRWSVIQDGKLGPALEDKYTINGVSKIGGDVWLVHARIQYGKIDTAVPIPVQVKWAGDTPVISITDLSIPGVGTYTARVVVHGNLYAGTWSGGSHGGVMSGMIAPQPPPPAPSAQPAPPAKP